MKRTLFLWTALATAALSPAAHAVDPGDASPYDRNPACMDTEADSSKGGCIIHDAGTPRHKFPPPGPASAAKNGIGTPGTGTTGDTTGTTTTQPAASKKVVKK